MYNWKHFIYTLYMHFSHLIEAKYPWCNRKMKKPALLWSAITMLIFFSSTENK